MRCDGVREQTRVALGIVPNMYGFYCLLQASCVPMRPMGQMQRKINLLLCLLPFFSGSLSRFTMVHILKTFIVVMLSPNERSSSPDAVYIMSLT